MEGSDEDKITKFTVRETVIRYRIEGSEKGDLPFECIDITVPDEIIQIGAIASSDTGVVLLSLVSNKQALLCFESNGKDNPSSVAVWGNTKENFVES